MAIILDFDLLRTAALNGIARYPNNTVSEGDRDGIYHGSTGTTRADKAQRYLNAQPNNHAVTFAVLLAIFGKPGNSFFDWTPGRSSRLAGLIADELINGERHTDTANTYTNTLASEVFARDALLNTDDYRTARVGGGEGYAMSYFDKTKSVRILLQQALQEIEPLKFRTQILAMSKKMRQKLDNEGEKINLHQDLPQPAEIPLNQAPAKAVPFQQTLDRLKIK